MAVPKTIGAPGYNPSVRWCVFPISASKAISSCLNIYIYVNGSTEKYRKHRAGISVR